MDIKVSDYIVNFIADKGVGHVFMLPGGMAMHINDSLGRSSKIKYVCCINEQGGAFMAESYARVTNNLGVMVTTCGPAATNTVTGIAASWIESTPLLVITGQVKRADMNQNSTLRQLGVQEVNIKDIVTPITKYAAVVTDPQKIRYELEKAVWFASHGRKGPVLLDIPVDVQACRVETESLGGFEPFEENLTVDQDVIKEIVNLIETARRPVIYAGAGIQMSGAEVGFCHLIDKLRIPVVTNWNGMGILPHNHPLYVGRPGAVGQRAANFVIQNSDLVIVMGTRLSQLQTGFNYDGYARNAKIVMVDIDKAELDKPTLHLYHKINADVKDFINALLAENIKPVDYSEWIEKCKGWNKRYPSLNPEWLKSEFVNSFYLVDEISSQMKSDDVYVSGRAGTCVDASIQAFKVKDGQQVFVTKGLSSMGNGLPAAIGAAYATGQKVVTVIGDGGFAMNIQELEVVKRDNLPIKMFILDNSGYSTIRNTQTNVFDKHFVGCDESSGLTLGNLRRVIEAYGIETFELRRNEDMKSIIADVLGLPGPVACVVRVDPEQPIVPRQASFRLPDGQMASRPLEDMKPLLSREELAQIMIAQDSTDNNLHNLTNGGG